MCLSMRCFTDEVIWSCIKITCKGVASRERKWFEHPSIFFFFSTDCSKAVVQFFFVHALVISYIAFVLLLFMPLSLLRLVLRP